MPLVKQTLEDGLRTLMDPDYVGFVGFPADNVAVADAWSTIVNDYASLVVPVSVNSAAAKAAFNAAMLPISASLNNGLVQLTLAFTNYAIQLGLGMQPAFTATPPPSPINIAPVFALGLGGASGDVTAAALATIIHAWFKTGTAINNSTSATVNWN